MLNSIIIHGRITNDLQIKNVGNAKTATLLQFSIANDCFYSGDKITNFFNCVAWNNNASFIEKHFKKGSEIIIIGQLRSKSYETQAGEKRTNYEIVVNSVEFGGSKGIQQAEPEAATNPPEPEEPQTANHADMLRKAAIKPKGKSVSQFFTAPSNNTSEEKQEPRGELPFEI